MERHEYFTGHYPVWTAVRINKLVQILGESWFPHKRILDVGCGHGNNGKALLAKQSIVTFTDARSLYVNYLKDDGLDARVMDQDQEWSMSEKFDLIIHWGVLYHLNNWKNDLKCAMERTKLLCLESEICDTNDPLYEKSINESGYDQSIHEKGTLLSAKHLENYVTSLGGSFVRYDDVDLDTNNHRYSWKEGSINGFNCGQRRFWMITTK